MLYCGIYVVGGPWVPVHCMCLLLWHCTLLMRLLFACFVNWWFFKVTASDRSNCAVFTVNYHLNHDSTRYIAAVWTLFIAFAVCLNGVTFLLRRSVTPTIALLIVQLYLRHAAIVRWRYSGSLRASVRPSVRAWSHKLNIIIKVRGHDVK